MHTSLRLASSLLLLSIALACAQPRRSGAGATTSTSASTSASTAATTPSAEPPAAADPLAWARDATFYEIFVRSFQDSDGDGVGDLRGLIDRLDYLNDGRPGAGRDLEVDALWLMPVFESGSYHGYDVTDYDAIERDYGTMADFDRLLREAHRRGMRVVLDLPLNHTSVDHPWFVQAARGADAHTRDWYLWRDRDPGWKQPWSRENPSWHRRGDAYYYGVFWSGMPDLNFRNAALRAEIDAVMERWLRRGVDGFRLDAVRHLVEDQESGAQSDHLETHATLAAMAARVAEVKPGALLVGEIWADAATIAPYFAELPMAFDFPLAGAMVEAARTGDAGGIRRALAEIAARYPADAASATFLTNHDMGRVATRLDGDAARLRLAASMLLTLPGVPFIYYGEELGLHNGPGDADEEKRTPMAWEASAGIGFTSASPWHAPAPGWEQTNVRSQDGASDSLLNHYRRLLRLRRQHPALRRGSWRDLGDETRPGLLLLQRDLDGRRLLVAHNLSGEEIVLDHAALNAEATLLFYTGPAADRRAPQRAQQERMPPRSSAVWELR